jgi:hypothetical protein
LSWVFHYGPTETKRALICNGGRIKEVPNPMDESKSTSHTHFEWHGTW